MSDNDDALYERIVRMIPVDALQNSYNNVIQDGVSSVNDAVDGAVAALAHLKEVRDAVDKLGQDRPQRNKNLLNTMNRTMALQLELELALQKVIQVENTAISTRKRSLSTDSSRSGISRGYSNIESNAGSEDKAIATTARLHLGRDRDGCDGLRKRSGEVVVENQKRMKLSSENATSVGTSRILNLQPPVEEKKMPTCPVKSFGCFEQTTVGNMKTSGEYLRLIEDLVKMSAFERFGYIRKVLLEIVALVEKYGKTSLREGHAVIFVRSVVLWPMRDNTDQKSLMDVYQRFLKSMVAYEVQMVSTKEKTQLKGLIGNFSWVLKQLESRASNTEQQRRGPVGSTQSHPPVVRAVKPLPSISSKEQQHAAIYTTLIKDGKQMPIRSRLKIIPRILLLLKDAMVTDEAGALKTAISDSIEELLKWMVEGCKMWQDLGSYQVFAVILSSYAAQHPEMGKLKSIVSQFSDTIAKIRSESTGQSESRQNKDVVQTITPTRGALTEDTAREVKSNENNKQRASGKLSSPKLELTKGNYLEKLQMMTQSSVGARRLQLPVVLVKLTDIALMSGSHEQLSILKYVLLWAKLSAGSGDDLSAYDEFCKDMAVIISKSPGDGRKAGLERLNTSLLALLKEQKTNSKESSTDMSLSYELMVFRANAMAPSDRGIQIPQVFSSLKKEMSRGAAATNVQEILKALRTVKQWANYLPEESNLRQLYGDLTEQIELYNRGVSVFHAKVSLTSEIQNFRTIAGIAISETIDGVLAKVKQLSEASGDQRLLQLDECILMFGKVLPRTGERRWPGAVVKSYELLLKYLEPCPPGFRNQRITALNKWMHPRRRR